MFSAATFNGPVHLHISGMFSAGLPGFSWSSDQKRSWPSVAGIAYVSLLPGADPPAAAWGTTWLLVDSVYFSITRSPC